MSKTGPRILLSAAGLLVGLIAAEVVVRATGAARPPGQSRRAARRMLTPTALAE